MTASTALTVIAKVYTFDSFDSLSLSDNRIRSIYESRQKRLWVEVPPMGSTALTAKSTSAASSPMVRNSIPHNIGRPYLKAAAGTSG